MTVSSSTNRDDYSGNGSTVNFAVNFRFLANSHVKVILTSSTGVETVQVETTNYTLTGAGDASGGTLTMLVAPASGETLTILRNVPFTQESDYVENDAFPAESHEQALDKLTMIVQQQQEELDRSLKLTESQQSSGLTIPAPVENNLLRWDSSGNFVNVTEQQLGTVAEEDLIKELATVAIMKSDTSLVGGRLVNTSGYTSSGDGGGARYLIKTAAEFGGAPDEYGDHTLANGNIAVLQNVDHKNLRQYGAVGDGVTDDTLAIKAWLAASGALYMPEGDYRIEHATVLSATGVNYLTIGNNTAIVGNARKSRFLINSNQLADGTRIDIRGANVTVWQIRVEEVNAVLVRSNVYSPLAIGPGSSNVVIDGIEVTNTNGAGFHIREQATDIRFTNNYIHGVLADGVHVNFGAKRVLIESNIITDCEDDCVGIVSEGTSSDGPTEYVTVRGNYLGDMSAGKIGKAVALVGVYNCIVEGNICRNLGSAGIQAVHYSNGTTDFETGGNHIIKGNYIEDTWTSADVGQSRDGITVSNNRNVLIEGNIVFDAGRHGISVIESCIDVTVRGNHVDRSANNGIHSNVVKKTDSGIDVFTELWTDSHFSSGRSETFVSQHNLTIEDNVVTASGEDGADLQGTATADEKIFGLKLRRNRFIFSNRNAGTGYGAQVLQCDRPEIGDNEVEQSNTAQALTGNYQLSYSSFQNGHHIYNNAPLLSEGLQTTMVDADYTLVKGVDGNTVVNATPLTAIRTLTLPTSALSIVGDRVEVRRTSASTGASNLSVGGIKNLATGQWCVVEFQTTGWAVVAFGSL